MPTPMPTILPSVRARSRSSRRRSIPPSSRAASRQRSKLPESYVQPSGVSYGNASGGRKLRRRTTSGSSPSFRAARSTIRSMRKAASGRPAPRYGPVGTFVVAAPTTSTDTAGMRYVPVRSIAVVCGATAVVG